MEHCVLSETMTTVILTGANDQYEIRHGIETSAESGYQEVICRVMAIAVCDISPRLLEGKPYHYCLEEYPFTIGHEWPGIVVRVGLGVSNSKVDGRVTGEVHRGRSACRNCKEGHCPLCLNYEGDSTGHHYYGSTAYGTYCQHVRYSCESLTLPPDNVSSEKTAICDTVGATFRDLKRAGVAPGSTACVIRPGPIDLVSAKITRCLGAVRVIVVDRGARLKVAVTTGACDPDKAVDSEAYERDDVDAVQKVVEMTGGMRPNNVYEASGAEGTIAQAIKMYKKGGSIAPLGTPPEGTMAGIPMKKITFKESALFGNRGNPSVTPAVVNLMATGQLRVKGLATRTFPLTQFEQGIDTLANRRGGTAGVIFYPNEQSEAPFMKA